MTEVVVTVVFLETIAQKVFLKTHFSRCSKVKSSTVFLLEVHVCFHSNSFNSFRQRSFVNIVILPAHFGLMINTHLKGGAHWENW